MATIKTKYSIGDSPLWLGWNHRIFNNNSRYKINKIRIEKASNYCNIYYDLIANTGSKELKKSENSLFMSKEELTNSIE